jgi:hypothetical protein
MHDGPSVGGAIDMRVDDNACGFASNVFRSRPISDAINFQSNSEVQCVRRTRLRRRIRVRAATTARAFVRSGLWKCEQRRRSNDS